MTRRRAVRCLTVLGLALGLVLGGWSAPSLPSAPAAGRWAPEASARIQPGVQMFTRGAQCTGNFVFTDRRGRVYVGYAAHCAGTGEATDVDGCRAPSHPLGTLVRFATGATALTAGTTQGRGRLVYSSWLTMRRHGDTHRQRCHHNDFALVKVGPRYVDRVNPTVPVLGGPAGLSRERPGGGATVHSYGSSSLRPGSVLSPRTGRVVRQNGLWSYDVYTVTPGLPGDSGAGFLAADGRAFGVLSTLAVTPLPASNGVSDLRRMVRYASRHSGIDGLRLVPGTRTFSR